MSILSKKITLIVPSKTKDGIELNLISNIEYCFVEMNNILGGATKGQISEGGYLMENGQIMVEKVCEITSFVKADFDITNFLNFCFSIKKKYNQECIAIIINNEMQLI